MASQPPNNENLNPNNNQRGLSKMMGVSSLKLLKSHTETLIRGTAITNKRGTDLYSEFLAFWLPKFVLSLKSHLRNQEFQGRMGGTLDQELYSWYSRGKCNVLFGELELVLYLSILTLDSILQHLQCTTCQEEYSTYCCCYYSCCFHYSCCC